MATKKKTATGPEAKTKAAPNVGAEYVNVMIDTRLCKQVEKNTKLVREAIVQQDMGSLKVSKHLLALKNQFFEIGKRRKESAPLVIEAFKEYIQVQFDIGPNRAEEYLGLTENINNQTLKLDISKLIEINRLSPSELKILLKKYSEKSLQEMNFRQVKKVVQEHNSNKRNKPKKNDKKSESVGMLSRPSEKSHLDEAAAEELTPSETIRTASEIVMEAIGEGEIPSDLAKEIDKLYKWKNEKQKTGKE